jgi:hypothetical protein
MHPVTSRLYVDITPLLKRAGLTITEVERHLDIVMIHFIFPRLYHYTLDKYDKLSVAIKQYDENIELYEIDRFKGTCRVFVSILMTICKLFDLEFDDAKFDEILIQVGKTISDLPEDGDHIVKLQRITRQIHSIKCNVNCKEECLRFTHVSSIFSTLLYFNQIARG